MRRLRWEELPHVINKLNSLGLSDEELTNSTYWEGYNLSNNNPGLVARHFQYKYELKQNYPPIVNKQKARTQNIKNHETLILINSEAFHSNVHRQIKNDLKTFHEKAIDRLKTVYEIYLLTNINHSWEIKLFRFWIKVYT